MDTESRFWPRGPLGLLGLVSTLAVAAPLAAQSTPIQLVVSTPGFSNPQQAINSDVLLDRIVFPDGVTVESPQFVFPAEVRQLGYSGTVNCFRTLNGMASSVGLAGCHRLEACDGNAASISVNDMKSFPAKLKQTFGNNNLNNRIEIKGGVQFSMTVPLSTRIWDSNFELDERPELFVFSEQSNSVLRVQACGDDGALLGTPVEVRTTNLLSASPSQVWVGRFAAGGLPSSTPYQLRYAPIDLTQLGVTSLKSLRITNMGSGGSAAADLKILAVDTSPGPAAQTMTFD
jgi:hypothetical protein